MADGDRPNRGQALRPGVRGAGPQTGGGFLAGIDWFMRHTQTDRVYPMHFWKDWSVFSGCGSCPARSPIGTSLHPNMNIRTNEKQEKRHSRFSCFHWVGKPPALPVEVPLKKL